MVAVRAPSLGSPPCPHYQTIAAGGGGRLLVNVAASNANIEPRKERAK